jgi:hypothetical protein
MIEVAEKNPPEIKSENVVNTMPLSSTFNDQKFSHEYVNLMSTGGNGAGYTVDYSVSLSLVTTKSYKLMSRVSSVFPLQPDANI